jgi:hypothetical protein
LTQVLALMICRGSPLSLDPVWLRREREVKHRAIYDIADEIGYSTMTGNGDPP